MRMSFSRLSDCGTVIIAFGPSLRHTSLLQESILSAGTAASSPQHLLPGHFNMGLLL